ncbi:MAG: BatA domain-containing protein [Verrucomicrobiales bacterium]
MGFAAILFGLPLAALPVIVHLLARRRKQVVNWGAMQFLIAARQKAKRNWRLRDLLLLALRVLVLVALIFAISRPSVPIAWLGGHEPRDIIVIIDESMSTAALAGTETIYERQQQELEKLFTEYDIDSTDHLRVLIAGAAPEWLSEIAVQADSASTKAILKTLMERKPSLASADLQGAIETSLAAASTNPGLTRRIFVVTDGQAYGWNPDMNSRWSAAQDKLKEYPDGSEIRIWTPTDEAIDTSNLVVQKVELAREVVAAMEPVMFRATVTNFGTNDSGTAILHWLVDDQEIGVVTVPSIAPNADSTVGLEHSFPKPGLFQVTCRMDGGDVLEIDDQATAIIEVATGIPVLIVEGAPSEDPLETDSAYLLAALGGFTDDDGGESIATAFDPTLINASALEGTDLTDYKVIVLANIPPVSSEMITQLTSFVRAGGGLWISLGDQMNPDWFNSTLFAKGAGLVPVEIAPAEGDADERKDFEMVSPPTQPHPATLLLADTNKLDIDRAHIYRRFPFAGAMPRDLSVLLQLDNGNPLTIERQLGNGRVIVQTVPLGASWSNMPLLLSYVAMVHEWLWYLVEPSMTARNLKPGAPIAFEMDDQIPISSDDTLALQLPSGESIEMHAPDRKVRYTATLNPGLYHFEIKGGPEVATFSVERDPEESNLARFDEADVAKLHSVGLRFGTEKGNQPQTRDNNDGTRPPAKEPIWEWLLVGVIVFLVSESLLALWISKGRNPNTAGASM